MPATKPVLINSRADSIELTQASRYEMPKSAIRAARIDGEASVKDLNTLMKQAQAMQQKLQEAQSRLAGTLVEGTSGGGMVKVSLAGTGEMRGVVIDEVLM